MTKTDYIQAGDYPIPAITLDDNPTNGELLGKYGLMRNRHLQENGKIQYTVLILKG